MLDDHQLRDSVEDLAKALGKLLVLPGIVSLISSEDPVEVETTRRGTRLEYPSPNVVRGIGDVSASIVHRPSGTQAHRIAESVSSVLYASGRVQGGLLADQKALDKAGDRVAGALEVLSEVVLSDPSIRARFRAYSLGHPPDDWDEEQYYAALGEVGKALVILPLLIDRFKAAFSLQGIPETAEDWGKIGGVVATDILTLRERAVDCHRLLAFLNSPVLNTDKCLAEEEFRGFSVELHLAQATDEIIAKAAAHTYPRHILPVGLRNTNGMIVARFKLPVHARADQAQRAGVVALEACRRVLDVLRIIRTEDIGIVHAHLDRDDWASAAISAYPVDVYKENAAVYMARRGAYGSPDPTAVTDEDISTLVSLLQRHLRGTGTPGFDVAVRRTRDAYERYWPGDPESLLDSAIALEALYLGDQGTKELRHRLSLRVARFLSTNIEARKLIARNVRNLYDLRSKIAHGGELKDKDTKKLTECLGITPTILRRSLQAFLEGKGPQGKDSSDLTSWWDGVELG